MVNYNNTVFYTQEHDHVFSFVYVYYENYLYTVRYNRDTGNTALVGTNNPVRKLYQDDMNNLADICYEYFNSEV